MRNELAIFMHCAKFIRFLKSEKTYSNKMKIVQVREYIQKVLYILAATTAEQQSAMVKSAGIWNLPPF